MRSANFRPTTPIKAHCLLPTQPWLACRQCVRFLWIPIYPEPELTEACQLLQDAELCMTRWCEHFDGRPIRNQALTVGEPMWDRWSPLESAISFPRSLPMFGAEASAEAKSTNCCLCHFGYTWLSHSCCWFLDHLGIFSPCSVCFVYLFWVFVIFVVVSKAQIRCASSWGITGWKEQLPLVISVFGITSHHNVMGLHQKQKQKFVEIFGLTLAPRDHSAGWFEP